jgi:MOSC domain-containing protein YiiM
MNRQGRVIQASVSRGGVPKRALPEARLTTSGIEGDGHDHLGIHGGAERAVCLYSLERIEALRAEGHPIGPGAIGENLTLAGIDWDGVVPGTRVEIGDSVVLEVTRYTTPCRTIRGAFADGDVLRVDQNRRPGWSRVYARVVAEGTVRPGDPVRVVVMERMTRP